MSEFDTEEKKLTLKMVYYGPALSGKTTNLVQLHEMLNPSRCGEFMTFETRDDRTLFFDLLPMMIKTESGLKIKIKLFTVPGQVEHDATRKAILSRADAVIFVADSRVCQSINNFESFENLEKNINRVGLDLDRISLVIQYNKRDLKDIISEPEVMNRWSGTKLPVMFTSAVYGKGVKETFLTAVNRIYPILNNEYDLKNSFSITESNFQEMIERQYL
jgi:mutual gliding-motility protein MglA